MRRVFWSVSIAVILVVSMFVAPASVGAVTAPMTMYHGDISLQSNGVVDSGHFMPVWDLTACDLEISFTYDANGLVDDFGGDAAHAWAELGVREVGYSDFNPTFGVEGKGVWLATDYEWAANTFDPDPVGSPTQDIDDKLILQKAGGHGEGDYNLPSTPPYPGANHRVWFDRDGVDQWQAMNPLSIDGGTYNTGGTYDIVITLHATIPTAGTAYMTINGLAQGFETDGNWNTMELSPAGMTFTGDMTQMQVFYGLYGYGAAHGVEFRDITVDGCMVLTDNMVTGGGWIDSPPGAFKPCSPDLSGNSALMSWGGYIGQMDRDEAAICSPNTSPVTFTGTVDVSGLENNGAVLIGLLDKKWIDDGENGYMGGAYTYFGRRIDNLIVGPSDGNLGGEIVQIFVTLTDYFDPVVYPDGPPVVEFETMIYDGLITVNVAGGTYTDDYGAVKTLNNDGAYAWDEFEFGAYAGIDSWPPTNSVLYDVTIEGCDCPAVGKANFGFVSRYKKGASVPTGQTEFVFKAADLNFHSDSYDWLVVNQGGKNAQFKGTGTINGEGEYKFMLWAGDGEPDTFRIKIWTEEEGVEAVVYDNGMQQPIGGGQIVIHKSK